MPRSSTRCFSCVLGIALSLGGPSAFAQSGITRVWALGDGEKVKRTDLSHWAASSPNNPVWDGSRIQLFGARNEVVAFQVILQSGSSGASNVNMRLDALQGPGGYLITNTGNPADPFDYTGKRIELFLQHYLNVTQRSMTGDVAVWGGARPIPDAEHLGWIPDALIPFQATPGTADWVGGAPFAIGAGRNQGVWVDIYIPRDAPAGDYAGTVIITEGGQQTFSLPVNLRVHGFTLPDSTHLHNMFYVISDLLTRHPGISANTPAYWNLFRNYMKFAHRHRVDLTDARRTLPDFNANLRGYYTGEWYSAQNGYDGPGLLTGNQTYCIGMYDQPNDGWVSGFTPATREGWQTASDRWEQWFRDNAPNVVRFKYMTDEPVRDTTAFYAQIRERAGWIHSNPGVGRNLPVFCTVKIDPRLTGAIDFWSLTGQSGYDPGDGIPDGYLVSRANQRRALGERVGIYNGTRPAFGLIEWIDNFATDPRINSWIAWKYRVDQYFQWETGWLFNMGPKPNPWVQHYEIISTNRIKWGHGTVLYTGQDNLYTAENRGINGPIASIRLKNWRRGQQDYEYLWLARSRGLAVDSIVNAIVPAAFDDYNGTTYTSQTSQPLWAQREHLFENARVELARLLETAPKTTFLPAGEFSADPDSLPRGGGTVVLSWTSTGATSATLEPGFSAVPVIGSRSVQVNSPTRFTLRLSNEAGQTPLTADVWVDTTRTEPPPPPPPPPQDTTHHSVAGMFEAVPTMLPHGGGVTTLSWNSTGATEAFIEPMLGRVPLAGSATVRVEAPTRFVLTLRSARDSLRLTADVSVDTARVPVTGSFQVVPSFLPRGGGDVALIWTSSNASSASVDNGIGTVALNGSRTVHVDGSTRFTLTLANAFSSIVLGANVIVDTTHLAPAGRISATPSDLPTGGGDVTLSWTSSNATSAHLNHGIGFVEPNGSRTVRVDSSTSFILRLANPWDTAYVSTAVLVASTFPPPSGYLYITPEFLPAEGGYVTLTWYSSNGSLVSLNHGIGPVPPGGTRRVFLDRSATFTLTVSNPSDIARVSASVTLVPSAVPYGANIVRNAGFQDGLDGWVFNTNAAAMVSVDTPGVGSATSVRVGFSGTGTVADLLQRGIPVSPGTTYRLSFDATATGGRDLDVSLVREGTQGHSYGLLSYRCDLSPEWKSFRIYFVASGTAAPVVDGVLRIALAPYAAAGSVYRIDNVSLQRVVAPPAPLTTPVLILPMRTPSGYGTTIDVTWTTSPGAARYHLQVSRDTAFTHLAFEDSLLTGNQTRVGPFTAGATYHIRIRSVNDSTSSSFGPASAIRVADTPGATAEAAVDYQLEQNYPNPFNAGTQIRYVVPEPCEVRLVVYDILGREITTLISGFQQKGVYQVEWTPARLPSGVYFCFIQAGSFADVRKMVLVK